MLSNDYLKGYVVKFKPCFYNIQQTTVSNDNDENIK